MSTENQSAPLISKTPLPRPLEREQWTVKQMSATMGRIECNGKQIHGLSVPYGVCIVITDDHNTSLRALQEELVAAKLRIKDLEEKEPNKANNLATQKCPNPKDVTP